MKLSEMLRSGTCGREVVTRKERRKTGSSHAGQCTSVPLHAMAAERRWPNRIGRSRQVAEVESSAPSIGVVIPSEGDSGNMWVRYIAPIQCGNVRVLLVSYNSVPDLTPPGTDWRTLVPRSSHLSELCKRLDFAHRPSLPARRREGAPLQTKPGKTPEAGSNQRWEFRFSTTTQAQRTILRIAGKTSSRGRGYRQITTSTPYPDRPQSPARPARSHPPPIPPFHSRETTRPSRAPR